MANTTELVGLKVGPFLVGPKKVDLDLNAGRCFCHSQKMTIEKDLKISVGDVLKLYLTNKDYEYMLMLNALKFHLVLVL